MNSCHLCGMQTLIPLLNFGEHPIAHNFLTSPSEEEYVHPVNLYYCESCGLIQLVDPIPPELLYTEYVCLSSWKAQPHLPRLVQLVEELPGLDRKSRIIEIGSNDGIFLDALRARGYENLLGVEPDTGFFSGETLGRPVANAGGNAILHLYDGGQHRPVAGFSAISSPAAKARRFGPDRTPSEQACVADQSLRVYVGRLRLRLIRTDVRCADLIHTRHGDGYVFAADAVFE